MNFFVFESQSSSRFSLRLCLLWNQTAYFLWRMMDERVHECWAGVFFSITFKCKPETRLSVSEKLSSSSYRLLFFIRSLTFTGFFREKTKTESMHKLALLCLVKALVKMTSKCKSMWEAAHGWWKAKRWLRQKSPQHTGKLNSELWQVKSFFWNNGKVSRRHTSFIGLILCKIRIYDVGVAVLEWNQHSSFLLWCVWQFVGFLCFWCGIWKLVCEMKFRSWSLHHLCDQAESGGMMQVPSWPWYTGPALYPH